MSLRSLLGSHRLPGVAPASVRRPGRARVAVAALLVSASLQACSQQDEAQRSFQDLGGDRSQRVAGEITALPSGDPLPDTLLDAHFFVETIGDGWFGPSDRVYFRQIQVAPGDL